MDMMMIKINKEAVQSSYWGNGPMEEIIEQNIKCQFFYLNYKMASSQGNEEPESQAQNYNTVNKKGIFFGILIILYEVLIIFLYGFFFGYNVSLFKNMFDVGGIIMTTLLAILLVAGFGLINSYVTKSAVTGMAFSLLIFAFTLQQFFLLRAFWNKAGANDSNGANLFGDERYDSIGFSNYLNDRQETSKLDTASFVDGIACALSLLFAVSPVIGRVGVQEIFFICFFGPFFYEVNSQIMHRLYITDTGYGVRTLLFGGFMGLIITFILGKRETTIHHESYRSEYLSRTLSLLGFVLVFCTYPILSVAGVYTYSTNDNYIIYAAPVNMWLALMAGVLGCFTISSINYRKFSIHDLIFAGLTGGFSFSSSSDINFNPAVPLVCGFIIGLLSSFNAAKILRSQNSDGVLFTYLHLQRFIIPGIFASFFSAILHGIAGWTNGGYTNYKDVGRDATGQGAFQLIGIPLSIGLAAVGGLLIGFLIRCINNFEYQDQFNDEAVYKPLNAYQEYVIEEKE